MEFIDCAIHTVIINKMYPKIKGSSIFYRLLDAVEVMGRLQRSDDFLNLCFDY